MLKRDIKYRTFDDEEVTETFYFNITKSEVVELEVGHEGGMEAFIKRIVRTNDSKALIAEFKRIILLAYGEKSDDGKRFVKSDELRNAFSQTAAYDALFMDLATNENSAVDFIRGVLPADMRGDIDAAAKLPAPNIQPVTKAE